jgi:hypothetical protein
MPGDGRTAQAFEDAHLDLVRPEGQQPVETLAKACHVFARQADDQVGMQMRLTVLPQPAQVVFGAGVVLLA